MAAASRRASEGSELRPLQGHWPPSFRGLPPSTRPRHRGLDERPSRGDAARHWLVEEAERGGAEDGGIKTREAEGGPSEKWLTIDGDGRKAEAGMRGKSEKGRPGKPGGQLA